MFEKEAEEFERRKHYRYEDNDYCDDIADGIIQAYQQGAEFGYNKANEWHYLKDRDLPKVGQKCYFIYSNFYGEDNKVIFSESSIEVLTGVYTFILDEETGDETTETCFYDDINDEEIYEQEVYSWKEITLPELPKEIKEND